MKPVIKIFVLLFSVSILMSACKKDEKDLENSYISFISSENGLWAVDNDLRYIANLKPGSISGAKATVTFTSQADPEGFSVEIGYYNTTIESGRDVYKVQQIDGRFKVGASTDADEMFLKVNPDGDVVTVTVGENVISKTISFEKKYDPLMVADITISGTGYISGEIEYYNETADRPEISMYSGTDPTLVTTAPWADIGDNGYIASDVTTNDPFGRTMYSVSLVYDADQAPANLTNAVMVNFDDDVLAVVIGDKTFSVPVQGETIYKTIMSPSR